jgi:hypothetical protein
LIEVAFETTASAADRHAIQLPPARRLKEGRVLGMANRNVRAYAFAALCVITPLLLFVSPVTPFGDDAAADDDSVDDDEDAWSSRTTTKSSSIVMPS